MHFRFVGLSAGQLIQALYAMELNKLENDILKWICIHSNDKSLEKQCSSVIVKDREFSGVGIFTYFSVSNELPHCTFGQSPVDPYIDSPDLKDGGGCTLFLKDGYLDFLEIYSFGNSFPKEIIEYELKDKRRA